MLSCHLNWRLLCRDKFISKKQSCFGTSNLVPAVTVRAVWMAARNSIQLIFAKNKRFCVAEFCDFVSEFAQPPLPIRLANSRPQSEEADGCEAGCFFCRLTAGPVSADHAKTRSDKGPGLRRMFWASRCKQRLVCQIACSTRTGFTARDHAQLIRRTLRREPSRWQLFESTYSCCVRATLYSYSQTLEKTSTSVSRVSGVAADLLIHSARKMRGFPTLTL